LKVCVGFSGSVGGLEGVKIRPNLSETGIFFVKGTRLSVLILAKSQAGRKLEVLEAAYLVSIYTFIE